jgi:prepilin-type N-terminal cleavage/methylation domain-containing protein
MKNNSNKLKAFSLIELSIVILIIGILVAGVTSSSRLITRMKLVTAQNLTRNSPVSTIKDLSAWYETSLDESFDDSEESDGSTITTWFDLNTQSSFKINAIQTTADYKPKYKINIFNGLPGIYFDGSNDFMLASSVGISGKGLSIFIVAKRTIFASYQGLVSGITTSHDQEPGSFIGYLDFNNGMIYSGAASTFWQSVAQPNPGDGTPFIYSTIFNGTTNISYLNTSTGVTVNSNSIFSVDKMSIGSRYFSSTGNQVFNGHVSEIIVFNRGLNTEERLAVNAYLSRKYVIKVS